MGSSVNRSKLSKDVLDLLPLFERVFQSLNSGCSADFYPHLSFEKRKSEAFVLDSKSQNSSENLQMGLMLRVFDGVTMFEASTDQLEEAHLIEKVKTLLSEVEGAQGSASKKNYYKSVSWKDRLAQNLDSEISSQIPKDVDSSTWVHFGTKQKLEFPSTAEALMGHAAKVFKRFVDFKDGLAADHLGKNPDLLAVRLRASLNEFVFMDREVRMTQALQRNAIFLTAVKGPDRGSFVRGGLGGLETLEIEDRDIDSVYSELAKMVRAERLAPGRYKVLMSPSITGVFAHEAFGHSQEADTWARGRSIAKDLYENQTRVGNDHATILNNPASFQNGPEDFAAWGSYFFDEEGWFAEKQVLVEKGWLKAPMTNLTSAIRLGVPRTANGKREAWTNGVYTRQTNTYFSEGTSTFKQLMEKVDYGFLATACFGGMEDPKGMGIQVGMGYLEEIQNGKLTGKTFKGPNGGAVQMTGYVPDYLNLIIDKSKIDAHEDGPDQSQNPWNEVGGCGKYHKEYVVAGCGGPFMLVDQVHLG